MQSKEALKRIRQETTPATYMVDFDKNECCDIIEKDLKELEQYRKLFNEPIQALIKDLEILEILKSLCEIIETPKNKYRYLKVAGVVVYTFKDQEEFNLFKEWLDNAK